MDTVTLYMHVPATIYPTLEIRKDDWLNALERLAAGEKPVLVGASGGHGCRGGVLPSRLAKVTLVGKYAEDHYEAEDDFWGKVFLSTYLG